MKYLILLLITVSCATVRNGRVATPSTQGNDEETSQKGLIVSGKENVRLSGKYFANFDFTLENKTNKFIKIKKAYLDFGDQTINDKIKIPVGNQLVSWANAARQVSEIDDYNSQLVLGSIAAAGAAVAVSSNSTSGKIAGATVMTGAVAGAATQSTLKNLQNIEYAPLFPSNNINLSGSVPSSHMYWGAFEVPPDLHTKLWATIYTEDPLSIPYLSKLHVIVQYEDGSSEKFKLNFRSIGLSKWQADHPDMYNRDGGVDSYKKRLSPKPKTEVKK